MHPSSEVLRSRAARIAALVAEAQDAPEVEAAIQAVVEQVADRLGDGTPADAQPLRESGLDEAVVARVLRGALFEAVEALRPELDAAAHGEAVLALRACLHEAIPRPPVSPEDRLFYQRLLEGNVQDLEPDYGRLLHLFENLTKTWRDIVYVHDLNGMMLFVNGPGLELTGFTVADVLDGVSIYDFVVPEFVDVIEARMESPGAVSRAPYSSEIYAKDGERIPMEITTRILRTGGRIMAVLGIAQDLRLARRLETEIRRSNVYVDTIVSAAPFGIVLADPQGTVLDANPAAVALLGAPDARSLVGAPFHEIFEEDPAAVRGLLIDVLAKGRERRLCSAQATTFGATPHCDMIIVPLHEESGYGDSLLILMAEAGEGPGPSQAPGVSALEETVRGVVHDVNNPLTAILGYSQLLLGGDLEPEAHARAERIMEEARRCQQSIRKLSDLLYGDDAEEPPPPQ